MNTYPYTQADDTSALDTIANEIGPIQSKITRLLRDLRVAEDGLHILKCLDMDDPIPDPRRAKIQARIDRITRDLAAEQETLKGLFAILHQAEQDYQTDRYPAGPIPD